MLIVAARTQVGRAVAGSQLRAVTAEVHEPAVMAGPSTVAEANQLAAYWLATASRIAQTYGRDSAPLTSAAVAALAGGQAASWWFSPTYWTGKVAGEGEIPRIMQEAAGLARAHGFADIASILSQQASAGAIKHQQQLVGPDFVDRTLAAWDPRPAWMRTPAVTWGAGIFGGLVILGTLAWFLRWSIGPYFAGARGVYRAVRA